MLRVHAIDLAGDRSGRILRDWLRCYTLHCPPVHPKMQSKVWMFKSSQDSQVKRFLFMFFWLGKLGPRPVLEPNRFLRALRLRFLHLEQTPTLFFDMLWLPTSSCVCLPVMRWKLLSLWLESRVFWFSSVLKPDCSDQITLFCQAGKFQVKRISWEIPI